MADQKQGGGGRKKRKRQEKLQQYGIELGPEIPGVPVQVIPLFVHALKVATKFFQHETSSAYNDDWVQHNRPEDTHHGALWGPAHYHNNTVALDTVLNRLESTAQDTPENQQQQQRKIKMHDAIQTWLQAVKRHVRNDYNQSSSQQQESDSEVNNINLPDENGLVIPKAMTEQTMSRAPPKSVPLCCFQYIYNLGQEHKRLAVRRAALHLNRHLLDKSSDCRRFFLSSESNHLWQWVQLLGAGEDSFDEGKQRLWQKEGHYLLLNLLSQNYDDLYPKLKVAEQYLRQACSFEIIMSEATLHIGDDGDDAGSTTNMSVLRQLRDIALGHGAEEIKRVNKLIQRAHKSMDILVPRVGATTVSEEASASALQAAAVAPDDNDEEDEDEIDWEDGWEDDDEGGADESKMGSNDQNESHAQAVERTLQAMESIGGFQSGTLEIDFSKANPTEEAGFPSTESSSTSDIVAARERFRKCAHFLSQRHLPRIRAWLEGLIKADRLYSPSPKASSLVLMPPGKSQKRDELQQDLLELKQQVLSVVQSAANLGLHSEKQDKK